MALVPAHHIIHHLCNEARLSRNGAAATGSFQLSTVDRIRFIDALNTSPQLTLLERSIGIRLICLYNPGRGGAWPSFDRLASDLSVTRRSIYRAIGNLLAEGWFGCMSRGKGRSNLYVPALEKIARTPVPLPAQAESSNHEINSPTSSMPVENSSARDSGVLRGGTPESPKLGTLESPRIRETKKKKVFEGRACGKLVHGGQHVLLLPLCAPVDRLRRG